MILTAISWGWIGLSAFLTGFVLLRCVRGTRSSHYDSPDSYIFFGLCALTTYAQFFSLFSKVGKEAVFLLGLFCVVVVICFFRQLKTYLLKCIPCLTKWYIVIPIIFWGIIMLYITAGRPWHSDTDLYHTQAIRWIEEYGVVKGLGNLHNRLAYNSSFFVLQTLYSLKFAVNQSLHTLNGFTTTVMIIYATTTLSVWKKKRLRTSDFFKLALILYFGFYETIFVISSPGSDILTLSMVLYICSKWTEFLEKDEKNTTEYGLLCLLAVWTVTLKLSAAMLVLLAIYPAVLLIRQKEWKKIVLFIGGGIIIAAPFLIRNVIISGYLIYPYSFIDLFNFDWEMPKAIVDYDNKEIMAWARNTKDNYDATFSQWFPHWFQSLGVHYKIMFGSSLAGIIALGIYAVKRHPAWPKLLFAVTCIIQFFMWFFTAPLTRYGIVYMLLIPVLIMGYINTHMSRNWITYVAPAAAVLFTSYQLISSSMIHVTPELIRQADYNWNVIVTPVTIDDKLFYYPDPAEGPGVVGYHYFPGGQYWERLDSLELRTGNIEDGFRMME